MLPPTPLPHFAWGSSAAATSTPRPLPAGAGHHRGHRRRRRRRPTDGVVIVPAFPDAGAVTIGGVHYMRGTGTSAGRLTPWRRRNLPGGTRASVFANSELAKYVEEKSKGRFPAESVIVLDLDVIRAAGPDGDPQVSAKAIADAIDAATDSTPIVADIVTENDLRALALGLEEAERRGKNCSTGWAALRPRPHRPGDPCRTQRRGSLRRQHPLGRRRPHCGRLRTSASPPASSRPWSSSTAPPASWKSTSKNSSTATRGLSGQHCPDRGGGLAQRRRHPAHQPAAHQNG